MPSNLWKKRLRFHESTQRALCRLVFLWLAFVPVLSAMGYSIIRVTPWYQSYQKELWQNRISDNLGVDVRFTSIAFPSPDRFLAHGLVCSHPETGREILKVARVDVAMDRRGWSVDVLAPELNGPQIQNALNAIHDWFLCRPQKSASLLKLTVPELLVYDGASRTRFENVEVGLIPTESTSTLIVTFALEGQEFSDHASFRIDRDHISESTKWQMESKEMSIPCRILSQSFPSLSHLGSQASFRGTIAWWQKNKYCQIQGAFHSVDLSVASRPIGSPVHGTGKLSIENAEMVDGDIYKARGLITSDSGKVDSDWLDRTSTTVMLRTIDNKSWKEMGTTVPMNQLALQFELDSQGLMLAGATPPPPYPNWPMLAAYVGNKAVACTDKHIIPMQTVSSALSAYTKRELSPARIADGRRLR